MDREGRGLGTAGGRCGDTDTLEPQTASVTEGAPSWGCQSSGRGKASAREAGTPGRGGEKYPGPPLSRSLTSPRPSHWQSLRGNGTARGQGGSPTGYKAHSAETLRSSAVGSPGARRPPRGSRPREQARLWPRHLPETGHEPVSSASSHMSSCRCGGRQRSGPPHTDGFWKESHAFSVPVLPTWAAPPLGPGRSESRNVREGNCRHPGDWPVYPPRPCLLCPPRVLPARWLAHPHLRLLGPLPSRHQPWCANNGATS